MKPFKLFGRNRYHLFRKRDLWKIKRIREVADFDRVFGIKI